MSAQIECRQATQADAAAIGTVRVASRDRPREHDGTAEGVAHGFFHYSVCQLIRVSHRVTPLLAA